MAMMDKADMAIETHFPIIVGENRRKFHGVGNNVELMENMVQSLQGVVETLQFKQPNKVAYNF